MSPDPTVELARPVRLVIEFAVFGAAAGALAATGHRTLAVVLAVLAVVRGTLNYVWD